MHRLAWKVWRSSNGDEGSERMFNFLIQGSAVTPHWAMPPIILTAGTVSWPKKRIVHRISGMTAVFSQVPRPSCVSWGTWLSGIQLFKTGKKFGLLLSWREAMTNVLNPFPKKMYCSKYSLPSPPELMLTKDWPQDGHKGDEMSRVWR